MAAAFVLPPPFQARIEALARDFVAPSDRETFDFATPKGEPALVPADSIAWRVFRNPLVLYLGGVAAVLLELAEPRIRDGLWTQTSFRRDPIGRLRRTGRAAMISVYGARSQAEAMIAGVRALHARISGVASDGRPYRADDPALLRWVHATASYGIMEAHSRFVAPLVGAARDCAYAEGQAAAALYGAAGAPASRAEMDALFAVHAPGLAASPILFEFLAILRRAPLLPPPLRPLQPLLLRAAVDLLPGRLRARLGLGARYGLAPWERPLIAAAARGAGRLILRAAPAVQACRRLSLPDDYLYR